MPIRTEYIQECRQMLELLNPSDLRYVYLVMRAFTGKEDDRHEVEDNPGRTPEIALTADREAPAE